MTLKLEQHAQCYQNFLSALDSFLEVYLYKFWVVVAVCLATNNSFMSFHKLHDWLGGVSLEHKALYFIFPYLFQYKT